MPDFPLIEVKKYFLLPVCPNEYHQDPVEMTEIMMKETEAVYEKYLKGESVGVVFTAHLKDEPVSLKKAQIGKTRVFSGAPMAWTIVFRMYYLSFVRLVQNNQFVFESGPGLVCQSKEWDNLYHHLTKFGVDRMVAGDYKSFDKTMSPVFMKYAFEIILALCAQSGNFTEDHLRSMRAMYMDIIYPLTIFKGDLVRFYGSNPSGHPLTVIINGLVNSLYIRYVYRLRNPEGIVTDFKNNVTLMTYGDDNIMGVSSVIDWFNHTVISETLSTMGITYTMADKESVSIPFIHIDQCTFLKRSWKYDPDLDSYVAPLDHDSIEKMLMVHVRSKTIHKEEQIIDAINSALREYFFYGKSIYQEKLLMLKDIVEQASLTRFVKPTTFPTWDQLERSFTEYSDIKIDGEEAKNLDLSRSNLKLDIQEYDLQAYDYRMRYIPQEILYKIMFMEIESFNDLHKKYTFTSEKLFVYDSISHLLGENLVHYNLALEVGQMHGILGILPLQALSFNTLEWRTLTFPKIRRPRTCHRVLLYMSFGLWLICVMCSLYTLMMFTWDVFTVDAAIQDEPFEDIINYPTTNSTANFQMPAHYMDIDFWIFVITSEIIGQLILMLVTVIFCLFSLTSILAYYKLSPMWIGLMYPVFYGIIVCISAFRVPNILCIFILRRQLFSSR